MTVELRCEHDRCRATSNCVNLEMFSGANVEGDWTYWRHADLITCPKHYADGKAADMQAVHNNTEDEGDNRSEDLH